MSMMDFAGALGPGGPGGPPGGLPPDLGDTDNEQGEPTYKTSTDALDAATDALQAFITMDHDHGDRATATAALKLVLTIQAGNQKDTQAGGMKSLTRALQGRAAAVGG